MSFIKSIIFILLTAVFAYFSTIFVDWAIDFYLNLSWFWLLIVFFFLGGLLVYLVSFIPKIFALFIQAFRTYNFLESFISTIILIVAFVFSCKIPWRFLTEKSGFWSFFAGITAIILIIQIYATLYKSLLQPNTSKD